MTPKHVLYLVPIRNGVGLTSISMGLVRAIDRRGMKVAFFKPIAQLFQGDTGPERSTHVIRNTTELNPPDPIPYQRADDMFSSGNLGGLLEDMVGLFHEAAEGADVIIVEGLVSMPEAEHASGMNQAIARALDASIILVGAPNGADLATLDMELHNTSREFGGLQSERTLGAIINFVNAPRDADGTLRPDLELPESITTVDPQTIQQTCSAFSEPAFNLLGCIPWKKSLAVPRMQDVANHLHAKVVHAGDLRRRRIHRIYICARNVQHITHVFRSNALLLIPVDRMDLLLAACMAAQNGIPLAGVILTSAGEAPPAILEFCQPGLDTGLPVLSVPTDSYTTATHIPRMNTEVPIDDHERINHSMDHVAGGIAPDWIGSLLDFKWEPRMSPAAFRYRLVQYARAAKKRIVLPEGEELRTIKAAVICHERKIARCVLLGNPDVIRQTADRGGQKLPVGLELIDPVTIRNDYVDALIEIRKHKGLDRPIAMARLEDNITLGTMMLKTGDVDGLVSGAVHTTAHTVRPALQIIKPKTRNRFVSSLFFMLLPEQVVIYADCAIHQDPDAETLAEIAIQSADSAKAFGLDPKVAMISYSTGDSGQGHDVEKVKTATSIARALRPDLRIDGPLQYDAASTASVAAAKAPDSPVAGQANVFIFPDLNTGNTTYKAVQRSANVISIGPVLQGLGAPVNDLSRGALVDDIVYTIAITAIQATQID